MAEDGERTLAERLLERALRYPGAHEDHPWGELVVKVDGKVFVFLGHPGDDPARVGLSVKLPDEAVFVIERHTFAKPTGYGLGRAGWVSMSFGPGEVAEDELWRWLDTSYRAVAKRRRVKELDAAGGLAGTRSAG